MEWVQMSGMSYLVVRHELDLLEQGGWPSIQASGRGLQQAKVKLCESVWPRCRSHPSGGDVLSGPQR